MKLRHFLLLSVLVVGGSVLTVKAGGDKPLVNGPFPAPCGGCPPPCPQKICP